VQGRAGQEQAKPLPAEIPAPNRIRMFDWDGWSTQNTSTWEGMYTRPWTSFAEAFL
jgi:hypothetical protein